jgi:hypothetical protein
LEEIGRLFDTNWVILTSMDRADPLKERTAARTIVTAQAKGLIGSKSDLKTSYTQNSVNYYFYVLLYLKVIQDHSIENIKNSLNEVYGEYGGIEKFCSERWAAWDLAEWLEEQNVATELVFPGYDKQKQAFSEVFLAVKDGRFKAPIVPVRGSKEDNILYEEMRIFDHNQDPPRWFGSPEKKEKYGVQDDVMFTIGWGIFGGRTLGVEDFRSIKVVPNFGQFFGNRGLAGRY